LRAKLQLFFEICKGLVQNVPKWSQKWLFFREARDKNEERCRILSLQMDETKTATRLDMAVDREDTIS